MDGRPTIDLRRRGVLLAGALAALAPVGRASAADAGFKPVPNTPDVIVYCDQTLRHGLRKAGETITARTGAPVRLFCTSPRGMVAQIAHVTQTDVLVTQQPVMDGAAAIIKPETKTGAWRNRLVFAARAGDEPSASNVPEMLGKGRLAVTDAIVDAPFDGRAVLQQIGALDAGASRIDGMPDTRQAAFLVTSGAAKRALLHATDVRADPRLAVAAPVEVAVPPYEAAMVTISRSPNAAAFVAFLRTPEATAALRDAGLEAA